MIQMQIIEQPGAGLHAELVAAMRSGSLQTFFPQETGKTRDAHDLFNPRLDEVDARGRRYELLHPQPQEAWHGVEVLRRVNRSPRRPLRRRNPQHQRPVPRRTARATKAREEAKDPPLRFF